MNIVAVLYNSGLILYLTLLEGSSVGTGVGFFDGSFEGDGVGD